MRRIYNLYQVTFTRMSSDYLEIEAVSRRGMRYIACLTRQKDGYWYGGSDFGDSEKKKFKGIVNEFFTQLKNEAFEYDNTWYRFHCFVTHENGINRPLTWDEAKYNNNDTAPEPTFKGFVKFTRLCE
jgi:hypothetical protein